MAVNGAAKLRIDERSHGDRKAPVDEARLHVIVDFRITLVG